ncbi:MAG: sulfurtransferase TusA family protein [Oscillospiraceae bacterium]
MSQTVDAMGKQCPIPVVMARQALQGMQTPDTLVVLVDNEVAVGKSYKAGGELPSAGPGGKAGGQAV